jgi:hypothetical protein
MIGHQGDTELEINNYLNIYCLLKQQAKLVYIILFKKNELIFKNIQNKKHENFESYPFYFLIFIISN